MRGENQLGGFCFILIEFREGLGDARRDRLDELRMRMPRLRIFDCGASATDFRARIVDRGFDSAPNSLRIDAPRE